MSDNSGFTPMPNYNKTLSAFDIRLQETAGVDDFLKQSEAILTEQVQDLLIDARDWWATMNDKSMVFSRQKNSADKLPTA